MNHPHLTSFLDFLFPRYCSACGAKLQADEHPLCLKCSMMLPRTWFWDDPYENKMAQLYYGHVRLEKVASLFFFRSDSESAKVIYDTKYYGARKTGEDMGRMMAEEMKESGFFADIDYIIPVPLSIRRRLQRGYNQSEAIAEGLSHATGIRMLTHVVVRTSFSTSQTNLTRDERAENVKDAFCLKDPYIIRGKHILLIDDVITTGATTISCAREILKAEGTTVSVCSLGFAGK